MHTCDGCYYLAKDGVTCLRECYPELDKPRKHVKRKDAWHVRLFKAIKLLLRGEGDAR